MLKQLQTGNVNLNGLALATLKIEALSSISSYEYAILPGLLFYRNLTRNILINRLT
jgi:hypothetical protein